MAARTTDHTGPERSPTRELIVIAAPTVLTMISYPLKQFIDAWMVGRLGPEHLAGQGNGAVAAFLPISFFLGLFTVVNTWVAQHLGAGRPRAGAAYAWNTLWLCGIGWVGMALSAVLVEPVFSALDHDPVILESEIAYARLLLLGSFFPIAARGLSHYFYGVHRPTPVLAATIAGNVVNLALDWVLIFGHLGFPALGVEGAAIATIIGGMVEFGIEFTVYLSPAYHRAFGTRAGQRFDRRRVREIWRLGWPGAVAWMNELICWGVFMAVLVGSFGAAHNAAGWIALRYMQLSFMPAVGMSIAVTAVVGRRLGAGDRAGAAARAWAGLRLAMVYMGGFAVVFVVFREPLVRLFLTFSAEPTPQQQRVITIGVDLMILAAVFQLFDAVAIVMAGALRGA
ncbi:MAG: MATE family efflux transporter, partial [Planctomycetota bacterium]